VIGRARFDPRSDVTDSRRVRYLRTVRLILIIRVPTSARSPTRGNGVQFPALRRALMDARRNERNSKNRVLRNLRNPTRRFPSPSPRGRAPGVTARAKGSAVPATHKAWRRPRYIGIAKCRPGAGDSAALMTGGILFVLVLVLIVLLLLILILILYLTSRFISLSSDNEAFLPTPTSPEHTEQRGTSFPSAQYHEVFPTAGDRQLSTDPLIPVRHTDQNDPSRMANWHSELWHWMALK
jgi:hypothetical protein